MVKLKDRGLRVCRNRDCVKFKEFKNFLVEAEEDMYADDGDKEHLVIIKNIKRSTNVRRLYSFLGPYIDEMFDVYLNVTKGI